MNSSKYFDYIEEKLNILATRINSRGKLNILDLHIHSENFYRDFFNELFNWELRNLNKSKQNAEVVDLICDSNKIVIQVSATCTNQKIESALEKEIIKDYKDKGYCFKFISISKNASKLRENIYTNPYKISFDPANDIYDIDSILSSILNLDIDKQKIIYEFIKKELGSEIDGLKLESNLTTIINILAKENLNENEQPITVDSFEIERKISFNNLDSTKDIIDDYKIHYNRVDKIYSVFDAAGVNKSASVLAAIREEYIKNQKVKSDDDLFYLVIDKIKERILNSTNFTKIPIEEFECCVNIIVVDAFIRCKIFENPNNYKYVVA